MKPDSNRLFILDAAVIGLISCAICLFSGRLLLMSILVFILVTLRITAVLQLAKTEKIKLPAELIFFAICTLFGAFNDWNSVCNKKIYDYTVPHYFEFSSIPIWMLLYWGMILRFIARMARWQGLSPPEEISNRLGIEKFFIDNAAVKVIGQLILVLVTRQCIYRYYEDPLLSWLPFLGALIIYLLFFKPGRHDLKLLGIFLIGGPLIEILYIQVGNLHDYHHGVIGGVPIWIALWWLVIILIWKDLAFRIEKVLRRTFS